DIRVQGWTCTGVVVTGADAVVTGADALVTGADGAGDGRGWRWVTGTGGAA
ncbi:hypothetical protein CRG98_048884, partial [Punica granatum]